MLPLAPCVVMIICARGSLAASSTRASPMVASPVHSYSKHTRQAASSRKWLPALLLACWQCFNCPARA